MEVCQIVTVSGPASMHTSPDQPIVQTWNIARYAPEKRGSDPPPWQTLHSACLRSSLTAPPVSRFHAAPELKFTHHESSAAISAPHNVS